MVEEVIKLVDINGIEINAELISILEDKISENKYLVYATGDRQKNGNLILFISRLAIVNKNFVLENIEDDEEWRSVKRIMSEMVSD